MRKFTTPPPPVDLTQLVPELSAYARTIVRLHPHCAEKDPPVGASKIGGRFLWPADEPWPMWDDPECPFVPVVQLRKADFQEMPFPDDADLFQLLWTPYRDETLTPDLATRFLPIPKVFWRKAANVKKPLRRIPSLEEFGVDTNDLDVSDNVPRMCSVHPERVVEYPEPDELQWGPDKKKKSVWKKILKADFPIPPDEDRGSYYWRLLSQCPGAKVGGGEAYTDDSRRTWEPVVVIPSGEYDANSAERWQPVEDRLETSGTPMRDLQNPMGLDLGRSQRVQISICRDLPGWPVDMVILV